MSVATALTLKDIDDARKDPARIPDIVDRLIEASFPIAIKAGLFHARPKLEPVAQNHGLDWQDLTEAFNALTWQQIKSLAKGAPEDLLNALLAASFPVARKAALFHLRPKLEPKVVPHGVTWEAVVGAAESFSIEDLKRGASDPDFLLDKMLAAAFPIAKMIALDHSKPYLEPSIQRIGLEWTDITALAEALELNDLKNAATGDSEALIRNLLLKSVPLAIKSALFLLKPRLLPLLEARGISWTQVAAIKFTLAEIETANLDVLLAKIVAETSVKKNRRVLITQKPDGRRVWQQQSRHGLATRRSVMQKVHQSDSGLAADHRRFLKKIIKSAKSATKHVAKSAENIGSKVVDAASNAGNEVKGLARDLEKAAADSNQKWQEAQKKFNEAKRDAEKGFNALKSLNGQDLVDGCIALETKIENAVTFDFGPFGKSSIASELQKQFSSLGCQSVIDEFNKMKVQLKAAAEEMAAAAKEFGDHLEKAWESIQNGLTVTAEAWAKILVAPTLRCASKRSKLGLGTNLVIGIDVNAFGMQKSVTLQLLPVPQSQMCKREEFSYTMETLLDKDPASKVQWMVFEPAINDVQFPCIKDQTKKTGAAAIAAANTKAVMQMACDSRCYVLVDGITRMVVNQNQAHQLQFERGSQISVIAVKNGDWAGMISEIDGKPTSASSWKCRTFQEEQKKLSWADFDKGPPATLYIPQAWSRKEFDDSVWSSAVSGDHPWGNISGISKSSRWVWSEKPGSKVNNMVVFCRYQQAPKTIKVACDDFCYVFVNGQKVATVRENLASSSKGPTEVQYVQGSQIAVVGVNIYGYAGAGAMMVRQFFCK